LIVIKNNYRVIIKFAAIYPYMLYSTIAVSPWRKQTIWILRLYNLRTRTVRMQWTNGQRRTC